VAPWCTGASTKTLYQLLSWLLMGVKLSFLLSGPAATVLVLSCSALPFVLFACCGCYLRYAVVIYAFGNCPLWHSINLGTHSLHVALFTSTWMFEISSFSAVDCGALSFPLNGSSYGGSTTFPNSVHFSCDPGFILHGSSKRTCMATGSWSGIATTCAGKWKLKKHLKQPWTGNPFTHTHSFTTHYALTLTLIYSLIRRARRNCCLLQRLELCLAKELSSELFRENFLVISKFYPLRYLSLVNRGE